MNNEYTILAKTKAIKIVGGTCWTVVGCGVGGTCWTVVRCGVGVMCWTVVGHGVGGMLVWIGIGEVVC